VSEQTKPEPSTTTSESQVFQSTPTETKSAEEGGKPQQANHIHAGEEKEEQKLDASTSGIALVEDEALANKTSIDLIMLSGLLYVIGLVIAIFIAELYCLYQFVSLLSQIWNACIGPQTGQSLKSLVKVCSKLRQRTRNVTKI
jgi:hypothetical protein